jgi:hypothetical protein
VQLAFEGVDVVKGEESEAFGGEEDLILGEGASDKVIGCGAGDGVCERVGGEPTRSWGKLVLFMNRDH